MVRTVADAVRALIGALSEEDLDRVRTATDAELVMLHPTLGAVVREEMRLWKDNHELLAASGEAHPDDASMRIIEALRHELRCRYEIRPH
jgi:hypothetical protein